jgi:4a-hydroxytetrahydrobiopterin dehydratase
MKTLTKEDIEQELHGFDNWVIQENSIKKTFTFKDFIEAFAFLSKVAIISEKQNHHPDWSGVYNKVVIQLSTHDAGGVTEKDILFAKTIEKF